MHKPWPIALPLCLTLLLLCGCTANAPLPQSGSDSRPTATPVPVPAGWELVWHDEFDGPAIDRTHWTFDIGGGGWGNGEAEYYTDRPENARVEDGLLVIEAHQEKVEGSYYTSARLKTQGLQSFQYGRIEARIKVPSGDGLWPAFWMLGSTFDGTNWPDCGEIDIMEYVGREPDLILGTAHGPGYSGALGLSRWNRQSYPIADDFHTFAIDWQEDQISWSYDGVPYYTLTPADLSGREWVFNQPFFLILNLAVGGTLGGTIGLDTVFPAQLQVDYVRVFQVASGQAHANPPRGSVWPASSASIAPGGDLPPPIQVEWARGRGVLQPAITS